LVTLTADGRELLKQVMPVWDAISLSMAELVAEDKTAQQLLPAINALENVFRQTKLADNIVEKLNTNLKPAGND
jgi:DNA-binding MarR family transcriptional regulator